MEVLEHHDHPVLGSEIHHRDMDLMTNFHGPAAFLGVPGLAGWIEVHDGLDLTAILLHQIERLVHHDSEDPAKEAVRKIESAELTIGLEECRLGDVESVLPVSCDPIRGVVEGFLVSVDQHLKSSRIPLKGGLDEDGIVCFQHNYNPAAEELEDRAESLVR